MICIFVGDKEKNEEFVKGVKCLDDKIKIFANDLDDDKEKQKLVKSKLRKSKIVICDCDIEKISYLLSLNKTVVVYNDKKKTDLKIKAFKKQKLYTFNEIYELQDILQAIIFRRIKRKRILLSFVFVILFCLMCFYRLSIPCPKVKTKVVDSNKVISEKIDDFSKENIVFYGDSITDYYDLEKYYDDIPVINSGISGNITDDLIEDIDERVIRYNPSRVIILIGTNDIVLTDDSNEKIVNKIIKICDKIHDLRKYTKIYVQSIYPVNRNEEDSKINLDMVKTRNNDRIEKINKLLKEKVMKKNYNYIDMYTELKDEDGNLNVDYTVDGLHISDEGYEVITKKINEAIGIE